ncbi:hypothetical protein PC129_g7044 [Phytophthora cactorum]|uniref:Uncharacterized protein n=1 Tax=Phytophthora cactorum TaxID=29920 RepID=A0A8T1IBL1_9STRA|nr:hypothetical protein PC129_g7044 [Phytophthora cactorum]
MQQVMLPTTPLLPVRFESRYQKQDLSTSGPTWFLPPELADWSDHDTSTNDGKLYLTTSSIHLHVLK